MTSRFFAPALLGMAFLVASSTALAAQTTTVSPVAGTVEILAPPAEGFVPLAEAGTFAADAEVRTGRDGYALIRYADGSEVVVRPDSRVTVGGEGTEGVWVQFGKVLLRVRKLLTPGQERAHRTPTTVAAVRGTQFGLAVDAASGSTRVYVFEGRVAVSNSALSGEPIEVGAGLMTEVDLRRPPTAPRTFDAGEFDGGASGGEVERGEDRAVEAGQAPVVLRYLAFADPDLDALENPAYLVTGTTGVSAVALGGAGASRAHVETRGVKTDAEDDLHLRGLGQGLARVDLTPKMRLGVFAQGDRGRDRTRTSLRAPGELLPSLTQDEVDWAVGEGRVLASVMTGGPALGVQVGHRRATLTSETAPADRPTSVFSSEQRSDITTLVAGVRWSGLRTVGVSYQHGWVRATTTSPADSARLVTDVDALEALVRQTRGLSTWAGWVRLERTAGGEDLIAPDGALVYHEAVSFRTGRVGLGWGLMPVQGIALSLDLAAAVVAESAVQSLEGGTIIEDEEDLRWSGSVHVGTQVTVSGPWRADLSVLHVMEHIDRDFPVHAAGPSFTDVRAAYGTSAGAGVMYAGDRWTVRYALTGTGGTRPWVHTLLVAASPR